MKLLKQKASERNPDEFSYKMMSSTVDKTGRKVADRGNKALSMDVVKLLKTQDAGYIRTMLQMVRKEREELEERVVLEDKEVRALKDGDEEKRRNHTAFVDDKEQQKKFKEDDWFGKGGELPGRKKGVVQVQSEDEDEDAQTKKLSKKQQEAKLLAEKEQRNMARRRERTQERIAVHLEAVKARERDLMAAEEELEKQRAKMNNTVGGINKHGVKFKVRERKR